nr:hypothetical protein [Thiocapsa sp. KS1]
MRKLLIFVALWGLIPASWAYTITNNVGGPGQVDVVSPVGNAGPWSINIVVQAAPNDGTHCSACFYGQIEYQQTASCPDGDNGCSSKDGYWLSFAPEICNVGLSGGNCPIYCAPVAASAGDSVTVWAEWNDDTGWAPMASYADSGWSGALTALGKNTNSYGNIPDTACGENHQ